MVQRDFVGDWAVGPWEGGAELVEVSGEAAQGPAVEG